MTNIFALRRKNVFVTLRKKEKWLSIYDRQHESLTTSTELRCCLLTLREELFTGIKYCRLNTPNEISVKAPEMRGWRKI